MNIVQFEREKSRKNSTKIDFSGFWSSMFFLYGAVLICFFKFLLFWRKKKFINFLRELKTEYFIPVYFKELTFYFILKVYVTDQGNLFLQTCVEDWIYPIAYWLCLALSFPYVISKSIMPFLSKELFDVLNL